jgi:hypothetical protein
MFRSLKRLPESVRVKPIAELKQSNLRLMKSLALIVESTYTHSIRSDEFQWGLVCDSLDNKHGFEVWGCQGKILLAGEPYLRFLKLLATR